MQTQKYSVNQQSISVLLAWVEAGEIAIPEIQRPFVWSTSKVRDLLDSLFQGFPVGYVISWQNPTIRLKDGNASKGKKILIDGQQRITALRAALLGEYVITKKYQKVRIKIAFNPLLETKFEVLTAAIKNDKAWIPDVSEIIAGTSLMKVIREYLKDNPEANEEQVEKAFTDLLDIPKKQIGIIELASDLDIETVTEIFIRINSQGVVLSQADFAMSKIASNESHGGNVLRKAIDYFSNLSVSPELYHHIKHNDQEFSSTEYFQKMSWLKDEKEDLYDPSYNDILRVAFTKEFKRGKFSDLVSLLSGRNFETRTFEEEIVSSSFAQLKKGVLHFMNEVEFKRFLMIIKSLGFIIPEMIRSKNALNFAYAIYLYLREQGVQSALIEKHVAKWFVYSILTARYSGSAESFIDFDIRQISNKNFENYLQEREAAELSSAFWEVDLVGRLETALSNSPLFQVFLASQVKQNAKGFLSRDITVASLIAYRGDIHHIFPKKYLSSNELGKDKYNQIANYVYMQQEINIKVGTKAPETYFSEVIDQCNGGTKKYGSIDTLQELKANMKAHCIPESIFNMNIQHYDDFLLERRKLMARHIQEYFRSL
jgi:hypothetical protein